MRKTTKFSNDRLDAIQAKYSNATRTDPSLILDILES
jgi:hypothetical protein